MTDVRERALRELKPYGRNPRKNDKAVDAVAESIREFGFKVPIVADKDGTIIAGHTRFKAAKKLGLETVPVIIADDLTPEQVKAFRLADNRVAELAEWDFELLAEELGDLGEWGMDRFGFDGADFDLQENELDRVEEDEGFDIDEALEDAKEPVSRPGDVWKLGEHRLMCGDSTDAEDVAKLMDGELADMAATDPPYNVNVSNSKGMTIENDNMADGPFLEFLTDAFTNMCGALKPGGAFYVWFATTEHMNFEKALIAAGLRVRQELIWNKSHFILGRSDYHWKHEPCLYGWKDGAAHWFTDDRTQSNVIEDAVPDVKKMKKDEMARLLMEIYADRISTTVMNEDKPAANDLHPTMKPVKLMARQVANSSKKGWKVLDLFGGSGSTLMACEQLGRKCRMMEYDPKYCDVIISRWEAFTGRTAERLKG